MTSHLNEVGSEWSQLNDLLRHFTPICLQKLYFGPVIHVVYYPKDIIITRVTKPYILTLKMFRRPLKPKYMPLQNMPALPFKSVETANFCSLQMHMDIYELGIVLSSSKMMKKTHFHKLLSYKVLSPHQCSLIQPSLVCSVNLKLIKSHMHCMKLLLVVCMYLDSTSCMAC